jgi:hypothetical protein
VGHLGGVVREKIPTLRTVEEAVHFAQIPQQHGGFEARFTGDALAKLAADRDVKYRKNIRARRSISRRSTSRMFLSTPRP